MPQAVSAFGVNVPYLAFTLRGGCEANPCPRNEDVVILIKECHDETTKSLNDIKQHLTALKTRVTAIEKTLNSVAKFKDNFDAVAESVNEVKSNISKTSGQVVEVVDDMNNRMRRNNHIIKGLPEGDHEGYTETEQIVRDLFTDHLKITAGDIERAHRFGQRRPGFHRPIIVKFLNFKSKIDALRNSYKLKNLETPTVWLEEDFSPSVQFARKKLRDFAKSNRTENARFQCVLTNFTCKARFASLTQPVARWFRRPQTPNDLLNDV
ncbi:hypothetical protein HPB51_022520 [Rhipicephalus microplus]|uniref:Uncharacterized protein n=1 Tax=Rhipicephalus microplus TaxID=6941 RepID=A0A9J6EC98_RHIMP|nr:hypothetical protein HPB51_022520 [Rhipicephalus microplus]